MRNLMVTEGDKEEDHINVSTGLEVFWGSVGGETTHTTPRILTPNSRHFRCKGSRRLKGAVRCLLNGIDHCPEILDRRIELQVVCWANDQATALSNRH